MFLIPQVILALFALKVYGLVVFQEYLNPTITRKVSFNNFKSVSCVIRPKNDISEPSAISGHFEFPPYSSESLRSVYHIRNVDVFKLKQVHL